MQFYRLLDSAKISKFHYMMLLVGSLMYCLTALDIMLIGAVVRPITLEWGLDIVTAGYLLSMGFVGMFFGALLFGRLSDIIGRKKTIIIVLLLESIFTALHGVAYDLSSLIFLRFLAGIGLGGALSQPGVYISEYVPAKYRGRFLGFVETSWVYGALLSLIFPYIMIPSLGWRLTFLVGLAPIIVIPFAILWLPESIRYLSKRGDTDKIREILIRYKITSETQIEVPTFESRYSISDLFSSKYIRRTILLFILWASLVYTYYGVFIWLPLIYSAEFKITILKSLWWTIVVTLFQIPGYYSATYLLDKIGRKKVLSIYLIIAGLASLFLALSTRLPWILVCSAIISFFNLGAWAALYTYTPELYPTEIRGFGSGTAASIGRVAGIIAPILTGYLYALSGLVGPYTLIAFIHIFAGFSVVILGAETMGKSLEEISEL